MNTSKISKFTFVTLAALAPLSGCATLTNNPNATIRVRVVDDVGEPIGGVHANVYNIFDLDTTPGLTDTNGVHIIHLQKILHISGSFQKQGYYQSSGVFWKTPEWGKVPPANTNFIIVLKRMIEPVQMRQRGVTVYSPRLGETVGFDFEIGDLVFPDGKGKYADILLTTKRDYISDNDRTSYVTINFTGEHNGIQSFHYPSYDGAGYPLKSDLIPPPIAPESGYEKTLDRFSRRTPPNKITSSYVEDRKWIFRTRTVVDDDGKIIAANYGWTSTEIRVVAKPESNGEVLGITFSYYYNPDPKSRSLEPKEIADRQAKDIPKEGGK